MQAQHILRQWLCLTFLSVGLLITSSERVLAQSNFDFLIVGEWGERGKCDSARFVFTKDGRMQALSKKRNQWIVHFGGSYVRTSSTSLTIKHNQFGDTFRISRLTPTTLTGTWFISIGYDEAIPISWERCFISPEPYPEASLGDLNYYVFRNRDFAKRNPGKEAPDYYLGFGDKYLNIFVKDTSPALTAKGQQFIKEVGKALQQKIEDKLVANPDAFGELELNPDSFRKFAYGTHPDAYCESGWGKLPSTDREKIIEAIDWKDKYWSVNGWESMIGLINRCTEIGTIDMIIDGIPGSTPLEKSLFVLSVISFTGLGLRGLFFWITRLF